MLFHVKHIAQVFPSCCIQLHGKRKEIAFIPQSSFDMATPDSIGISGLLRGCNVKAVRKGGLGLSQSWSRVGIARAM